MKKSVLPNVSKRLAGLTTVLSFIFLFFACSESDSVSEVSSSKSSYKCTTCKTSPEALPQNDNSNKGIYFGVLKEGVIFIDVDNQNDGQVFARLNNSTDSFLNLDNSSNTEDEYTAVFSGLINHVPATFVFKVSADGSNPSISFLDSAGKTIDVDNFVYKEKSNAMVEVFKGTIRRRYIGLTGGEPTDKPDHELESTVNYEFMANVTYLFSRATNAWSVLKVKADNSIEANRGTINGNKLIDEDNINAGILVSDEVSQEINLHENGRLITDAFRVW
ncbi:MAG: hypothetical protein ABI426_04430 [Flavobacterium sp.]